MRVLCYYHYKDLDGLCSAAIVRARYPLAKFVGWHYGEEPWLPKHGEFDYIIMVDICMPMEVMVRLNNMCEKFVWIDHHRSSINEYIDWMIAEKIKPDFGGIQHPGLSACELTWMYFYEGIPTPEAVLLIGEYDTWRGHGSDHWNADVLPFQYGMSAVAPDLDQFPDILETSAGIDIGKFYTIKASGVSIIRYQKSQDRRLLSDAYETALDGVKCIAINVAHMSVFLQDMLSDKCSLLVCYHYSGGKWKYSLRSRGDIDVSEIAKKHGGGGHKNAAGFALPSLIL